MLLLIAVYRVMEKGSFVVGRKTLLLETQCMQPQFSTVSMITNMGQKGLAGVNSTQIMNSKIKLQSCDTHTVWRFCHLADALIQSVDSLQVEAIYFLWLSIYLTLP